jgi:NADPH-dependent curcumin reductase CurA
MNTQIVMTKRPIGWVDTSCFAIVEAPDLPLAAEAVVVESIYLSLDPFRTRKTHRFPRGRPDCCFEQCAFSNR